MSWAHFTIFESKKEKEIVGDKSVKYHLKINEQFMMSPIYWQIPIYRQSISPTRYINSLYCVVDCRYMIFSSFVVISWKSIKQKMVITSSNHLEILTIHEAYRECVQLRSMIKYIWVSCELSAIQEPFIFLWILQHKSR